MEWMAEEAVTQLANVQQAQEAARASATQPPAQMSSQGLGAMAAAAGAAAAGARVGADGGSAAVAAGGLDARVTSSSRSEVTGAAQPKMKTEPEVVRITPSLATPATDISVVAHVLSSATATLDPGVKPTIVRSEARPNAFATVPGSVTTADQNAKVSLKSEPPQSARDAELNAKEHARIKDQQAAAKKAASKKQAHARAKAEAQAQLRKQAQAAEAQAQLRKQAQAAEAQAQLRKQAQAQAREQHKAQAQTLAQAQAQARARARSKAAAQQQQQELQAKAKAAAPASRLQTVAQYRPQNRAQHSQMQKKSTQSHTHLASGPASATTAHSAPKSVSGPNGHPRQLTKNIYTDKLKKIGEKRRRHQNEYTRKVADVRLKERANRQMLHPGDINRPFRSVEEASKILKSYAIAGEKQILGDAVYQTTAKVDREEWQKKLSKAANLSGMIAGMYCIIIVIGKWSAVLRRTAA
eukprot:SAG31_NODE_832_length_11660_cov_2.612091_8_plen_469_part_00